MEKVIVMDIDDVISRHINRDYVNAIPQQKVISRMRHLASEFGVKYKLYTSRGQKSCNGNIKLIEKNNRAVLEKWLEDNDVPYDELIFGKPLGDLYVDDKAISSRDFMNCKMFNLQGGSGMGVFKFSDYVKKECKNAKLQADWYSEAKKLGYNVPEVISYLYDTIYLEYIDGAKLAYEVNINDVSTLVGMCLSFSNNQFGKTYFDYDALSEKVRLNDTCDKISRYVTIALSFVSEFKINESLKPSLCHGDLTLSNVIKSKSNKLYMIDPLGEANMSSYMLDLAQIRKSLNGFEEFNSGIYDDDMLKEYDDMLKEYDDMLDSIKIRSGKDTAIIIVKKLEFILWVRLWRYRGNSKDRFAILSKLENMAGELI